MSSHQNKTNTKRILLILLAKLKVILLALNLTFTTKAKNLVNAKIKKNWEKT